jgi:large subunit ribosomal protein L7/L12
MATKREQLINDIGSMSVLELAELVKDLESKFGVSAAMPMMAGPAMGAPAAEAGKGAAEEKSEYTVKLTEAGPDKIKTIKALRSVTTLGLTEAKQAVEGAPTELGKFSKEDANKMKEAIEAAGAKVAME